MIFNLVGWAFKKTRRIHLFSMILVSFSWFILGLFYGFGYCFLTELQYQIRLKMGKTMSNSFIAFILNDVLSFRINEGLIDVMTGIVFGCTFLVSLFLNFRLFKKGKKNALPFR